MYRILAVVVVLFVIASCKYDNPGVYDPSGQDTDPVDSLKLSYLNTGIAASFYAVYFCDANNGYLAGSKGAICHTTDGGNSWKSQASSTDLPLHDIYFLDSQEGFAVGGESECSSGGCVVRGAVMVHTKDGGATWERVVLPTQQKIALTSICFADDSTGFAVGGHTILSTRDRGLSWKETILTELQGIMIDVVFGDTQKGLIGCSKGKVARTTDGGLHWTISTPFDGNQHYRLSRVDENTAFIAGQSYIGKSDDFGGSWTELPTNPGTILTLQFKSSLLGYAFGEGHYSGGDWGHYYGSIYYTFDGGAKWTINNKLTQMTAIEASFFPTPDIGYAVSDNKVMKVERKKND